MSQDKVSIVIVSYNTKKLTLECLKSVFHQEWKYDYKVIVVDNNSTDGSVEAMQKFYPQVQIIQNKQNLGFGKANNQGMKKVKDGYCLLLNSDTKVLPNSLDNLVDFAKREGMAIASCKLLNKDLSLQPNAGDLPNIFSLFFWISGFDDVLGKIFKVPSFHIQQTYFYQGEKKVGWVSGSVMLLDLRKLKRVGFFDERIFMYGEDVDLCFRAQRKGLSVGWTDRAEIIHLGGGSSAFPRYVQWRGEFKGLLYLYRKYYGFLAMMAVNLLIHFFIGLRIIAFAFLGKFSYSKTYAKIFVSV